MFPFHVVVRFNENVKTRWSIFLRRCHTYRSSPTTARHMQAVAAMSRIGRRQVRESGAVYCARFRVSHFQISLWSEQ